MTNPSQPDAAFFVLPDLPDGSAVSLLWCDNYTGDRKRDDRFRRFLAAALQEHGERVREALLSVDYREFADERPDTYRAGVAEMKMLMRDVNLTVSAGGE